MKYILIWAIWTYVVNTGALTSGTAEFYDNKSCQVAANDMRQIATTRTNVFAVCYPKGE